MPKSSKRILFIVHCTGPSNLIFHGMGFTNKDTLSIANHACKMVRFQILIQADLFWTGPIFFWLNQNILDMGKKAKLCSDLSFFGPVQNQIGPVQNHFGPKEGPGITYCSTRVQNQNSWFIFHIHLNHIFQVKTWALSQISLCGWFVHKLGLLISDKKD